MADLIETFIVLSLGWVAVEVFLIAHESHSERRERRRVERVIARKYPPVY